MALGLRSVADDLGVKYDIIIQADATAAIGMARRGGIGKVRHLDVSLLWIQSAVRRKAFVLQQVLGTENIADALTKYLDRPDLDKHIRGMYLIQKLAEQSAPPCFEWEDANTVAFALLLVICGVGLLLWLSVLVCVGRL